MKNTYLMKGWREGKSKLTFLFWCSPPYFRVHTSIWFAYQCTCIIHVVAAFIKLALQHYKNVCILEIFVNFEKAACNCQYLWSDTLIPSFRTISIIIETVLYRTTKTIHIRTLWYIKIAIFSKPLIFKAIVQIYEWSISVD